MNQEGFASRSDQQKNVTCPQTHEGGLSVTRTEKPQPEWNQVCPAQQGA